MESEGCLRDAESLLDQAIALCGKTIKIEELSKALSLIDRGSFFKLVQAIGEHDTASALKLCVAQFENGLEPKTLLGRLTEFFSDLHFFAFTGTVRNPDPDQDALMVKIKNQLAPDEIIRALDACLKQQTQITHSVSANYALESLVIRLCIQRPALVVTQAQTQTQTQTASSPLSPSLSQPQSNLAPPVRVPASPVSSSVPSSAQQVTGPRLVAKNDLSPLEVFIRAQKPAWFPVLQSVLSVRVDENSVSLVVRNDFAGKRLASNDGLEVLKKAYAKTRAEVSAEQPAAVGTGADGKSQAVPPQDPREKIAQKHKLAKEHEAVKAALSIFENSSIIEAKVLDDVVVNPRHSIKDNSTDLI
jgi:DNA polymerase III gamma/tau subunit